MAEGDDREDISVVVCVGVGGCTACTLIDGVGVDMIVLEENVTIVITRGQKSDAKRGR